MDNTQLGTVLLCLTCGVPFLFGSLVGVWIEQRRARDGWLGVFIPRFLREWIERTRDGL